MGGHYLYAPQVWPFVLTILFLIALSYYSWRRRTTPGALQFAISGIFPILWTIGIIFEISAVDPALRLFWQKYQAIWPLPTTVAMTCFVLEYAWPGRWLNRRSVILLSLPPLLVAIEVLFGTDEDFLARLFPGHGTPMHPVYHHAYWIFMLTFYFLTIVNLIVFIWLAIRSPQQRWPAILMMGGQVVGRLSMLSVVTGFELAVPVSILSLPFLFPYMIYALALFGFRIFDPMPLARQMAVDQIHAGMLVLDSDCRIVSLNPSARRMLRVEDSVARGRLAREFLPACPESHISSTSGAEVEFTVGAGEDLGYYTLAASELKDWRGLVIGHLVLLRDITGQKQASARILEQQRALAMLNEREQLARELHDSLGQVFAFVHNQGQLVKRLLERGDASSAAASVDRIVEVAREADIDIRESILGLRASLSANGLFPALEAYLARYQKSFGICTELQNPQGLTDGAFDELVEVQLLRIIQEALTNIRKHADARCVWISILAQGASATVTIQDDGQGLDLFSASPGEDHVGLRVMRERAEQVGGSLSLQSEPGNGLTVRVSVPLKEGWQAFASPGPGTPAPSG